MSPRLKTTLISLSLLAATLLIAVIIWWAFFLTPIPDGVNTDKGFLGRINPDLANQLLRTQNVNRRFANVPLTNVAGLPQPSIIAHGGPTIATTLVPDHAGSLALNDGQNPSYYDKFKGQFIRINGDGTTTKLADVSLPGADKVDWAPDGSKVVLTFPDASKVIYDFEKKQQTTLPREAEDFSFSPDSDSLAYKFLGRDPSDNWLAVSNSDGSNTQFIEPLGDRDKLVSTDWSPNRQIVATYAKGANASQQEVIFLGTKGENFPSTIVDGTGFQNKWSPDGKAILYTVRNDVSQDNPTLWVMDGQPDSLGQRQVNLGVQTFVDKCAFGSSSGVVYCAVPEYLEPGSGIYPELSYNVPDQFYKIDLVSGSQELLARPTDASGLAGFSATDVVVSDDGSMLYFRDRRDNAVHQVRLK